MNIEKINPWNWFKYENSVPVLQKHMPATHSEAAAIAAESNANSLLRLHSEMDSLFNHVFSSFGMPSLRSAFPGQHPRASLPVELFIPNVDIAGDEKQYEIVLDVPGLSESDLSIDLKGDVLMIRGQKTEESGSKEKQFYRVERSSGSFQRTLSLPDDAVAEEIYASLKDGVLKLTVPRRQVLAEDVKRINISSY